MKTFINSFFPKDGDKEKDVRDYFNNANPITLEIGCGHADITLRSAEKYPGRNFIGVDVKKTRLWNGAKEALDLSLNNAAFLSASAEELNGFFITEKIDEIWIPFPDPYSRQRSEKKRLIAPSFMNVYKDILNRHGRVHLKTDNEGLFNYALDVIKRLDLKILEITDNLYLNETTLLKENVQTVYEKHYLIEGRIIKYVCFSFRN